MQEAVFPTLPKRSAIDLASCVVHDIEEASSQKWMAIFVTLDIQGAFDGVYITTRSIHKSSDSHLRHRIFETSETLMGMC